MTRVMLLALIGIAGPATDAAAQKAAPPLEIGFDAIAVANPNLGGFGRGPRVVVNFDGRNALELTGTLQQPGPYGLFEQQDTDFYLVAFKRVVHASGPARVFTILGGGLERTTVFYPGSGVFPPSTSHLQVPAITVGGGMDFRLGRHAAIVLESSFIFSGQFAGRFSAGLVVPIGAYPERPSALSTTVPWRTLDEGERAWVTSGGREVSGEVVRRSSTHLALRTPQGVESFGLDEIEAIDITDPVRNGTVLGAKIGAAAGLGQSIFVSLLLCAMEECTPGQVIAFNATFVGMSAGVGAATGALIDSLRERRSPLYRRRNTTNLTIAPLLGKQAVGVGAAIQW